MAKRVILSKKAEIDLERIIDFNNNRNKSDTYSKKLFSLLIKRLNLLTKQPLSGLETVTENVLLLVWDDYYIFYTIEDTTLIVSSIYHQKENISR